MRISTGADQRSQNHVAACAGSAVEIQRPQLILTPQHCYSCFLSFSVPSAAHIPNNGRRNTIHEITRNYTNRIRATSRSFVDRLVCETSGASFNRRQMRSINQARDKAGAKAIININYSNV